jgi:signal peptidase II
LKKITRDYGLLFLISGFVIALDQITKALVRQNIALGDQWSPWPWLSPYARIVHWYNTGVAFGLFQGKGDIFMILAVVVALAIIYYYPRVPAHDWTLRVAMGLQLGGAVGNLIDRVWQGHVTDFLSVGTFAVFNVADASITVGVVVLLIGVYIQEQRAKKTGANLPVSDSPVEKDLPSNSRDKPA